MFSKDKYVDYVQRNLPMWVVPKASYLLGAVQLFAVRHFQQQRLHLFFIASC